MFPYRAINPFVLAGCGNGNGTNCLRRIGGRVFKGAMEKRALPFPTSARMTEHAFTILDDAVRLADKEPIVLTPAIRLALCWVTVQGLTKAHQVEQFWQNMILPVEQTEFREPYCRSRDMSINLEAWKQKAREKGLYPPAEIWGQRRR